MRARAFVTGTLVLVTRLIVLVARLIVFVIIFPLFPESVAVGHLIGRVGGCG